MPEGLWHLARSEALPFWTALEEATRYSPDYQRILALRQLRAQPAQGAILCLNQQGAFVRRRLAGRVTQITDSDFCVHHHHSNGHGIISWHPDPALIEMRGVSVPAHTPFQFYECSGYRDNTQVPVLGQVVEFEVVERSHDHRACPGLSAVEITGPGRVPVLFQAALPEGHHRTNLPLEHPPMPRQPADTSDDEAREP